MNSRRPRGRTERRLWDPAVDVHIRSRIKMCVGDRLRAETMLSRWVHHVAQAGIAFAFGIGAHDTGANQPTFILACGGLADPLIEGRTKAVADALVQGTRLPLIAQSALVLGDALGELVANDVGRPPEVDKNVL